METTVELIDAAKAAEYLSTRKPTADDTNVGGNRRYKDAKAVSYAQAMLSGAWELTHQGIAFDETGSMTDGSHRMYALTLAARVDPTISLAFMVTRGVSEQSFSVIDTGQKRTARQFLDEPYADLKVALVRSLMAVRDAGWTVAPSTCRGNRISDSEVLVFWGEQPEVRDYARKYARQAYFAKGVIRSTNAAGLLIGGLVAGRSADWWADVRALTDGAGLPAGHPVWTLFTIRPTKSNQEMMYRALYAGNKFRLNEPSHVIRVPSDPSKYFVVPRPDAVRA